ncbi:AAA family ATPase [Radiobacillus sp. PE A8.2]|uniref:AAA family ATPase n=1 Tax=Radiobacillus sp. PE A8.2 TaxID=3380349 RepID=UPI00388EAFC1
MKSNQYQLLESSWFVKGYKFVKALRVSTSKHVIIRENSTDENQRGQALEKELYAHGQLSLPHVLRPVAVIENGIVLEDTDGIPLHVAFKQKILNTEDALHIVVQLAQTLQAFHQQDRAYLTIVPEQIILQPNNQISILPLPKEINSDQKYQSPESILHKGKAFNYRADLYAFGILLYEIFTNGKYPFADFEHQKWKHLHISVQPIALTNMNRMVPAMINNIVMTLLEKDPLNRYQYTVDLVKDLSTCYQEICETGNIQAFPLSLTSNNGEFAISAQFYGREKEIKELYDIFQRAAFGATELVFINGPAGIGKTTLVQEQFKGLIQNRAYFISGKFDQVRQNIPYQALVKAFKKVIQEILMKPNDQVEEWRMAIQKAIGRNGKIITDVIPELTDLIGEQPHVESLSSGKLKNRFVQVFRNFVMVFATVNQPLVLFLDEIQWADDATLDLLDSLLADPMSKRFFVIASVRQEGDMVSAALQTCYDKMEKAGQKYDVLTLSNLLVDDVAQLVADSLHSDEDECFGLAQLIFRKTAGNPFYVKQLLQLMETECWLTFDKQKRKWSWNEQEIEGIADKDYIVAHMVDKLNRLPKHVFEMLKVAACFGTEFYQDDLHRFSTLSTTEVNAGLILAQAEGLVLGPDKANGKKRSTFFHDHIREMAYSLLKEEQKKQLHLRIGRFLNEINQTDAVLYKVVYHYNKGKDLIDVQEKEKLLLLNEHAGNCAKKTVAYQKAAEYYREAVSYLDDKKWVRDFSFCFNLYLELADVEYLCGNNRQSECLHDYLLKVSQDWESIARVYSRKISVANSQGNFIKAIEIGLSCLNTAGLNLAMHPDKIEVRRALTDMREQFPKGFETLRDLPDVRNREVAMAMDLLYQLLIPSYYQNRDLHVLLLHKFIELTLAYGKVNIAPAVYVNYGILLCTALNQVERGYRIGQLAVSLAEDSCMPSILSKVYVLFGGGVCQWYGHGENGLPYVKKALKHALNVGDYVFASNALAMHMSAVYMYETLDNITAASKQSMVRLEQINDSYNKLQASAYIQFARCLQGLTDDSLTLENGDFNEAEWVKEISANGRGQYGMFQYYTYKTQIAFIHEHYTEATDFASQAEDNIENMQYFTHYPEFLFYKSLASAQSQKQHEDCKQLLREMAKVLRQFSIWRKDNKNAFEHKEWLLRAEYARIEHFYEKAACLYEQAIKSAETSGYGRNVAIAHELTAKFYLAVGRDRLAKFHFQQAVNHYKEWGATLKVKLIRQAYPAFCNEEQVQTSRLEADTLNDDQQTDLESIVRISETLSDEVNNEKLLKEWLCTIKQRSLAERAIFFTVEDKEIYITSIVTGSNECTIINESLENALNVPRELIRYVSRSQRIVQVDNMTEDEVYKHLSYVKRHKPKSALCLPISVQGQIKGILYLENHWIAGLFTKEQVDTVKHLGTQMIISYSLLQVLNPSQHEPHTKHAEDTADMMLFDELTEREIEVLNLMAAGNSNQEIARKLGLKEGTVKVHNHNIFTKLGVNRRTKAVFKAKELRLLYSG